jgi:hypothetical protein
VTKRVCGIGPSTASTRSNTPSTIDRGVLREDGDPALALEVVGIHHPLDEVLVRGEGARLLQQLVDQGRFAVVDVGDDGDVSEGPGH